MNRRNDETLAAVTAEKAEKPQLLVGKNQRVQFYNANSVTFLHIFIGKVCVHDKKTNDYCNQLLTNCSQPQISQIKHHKSAKLMQ